MLSKLRIGPKLLLAPCIVLVLLLILAAGAYLGMARQNQSLDNLMHERAVRLQAAAELVAGTNRAHTQAYQLLTWINGGFTVTRTDQLVRAIAARHAALDQQFARLERITRNDGAERRLVRESRDAHAQYVKAVADAIDIAIDDHSIAANAMSRAGQAFDVVAQRLDQLSQREHALGEHAYRAAEADFVRLSIWIPALVVLSISLGLLVTLAVRNAVLTEVRAIGAAAVDLAEGNLTVKNREYGSDEIAGAARALDTSVRNLNITLKTILASAQTVDGASRQVARGSAGIRVRAERQAASLQEAGDKLRALGATGGVQAGDYDAACAAILEVDRVTRHNLARVRQAAVDASNLQRQAVLLSQAVARFKLVDSEPDGGSGGGGVGGADAGARSSTSASAPEPWLGPGPAPGSGQGGPRVVRLRLASVRN